MPFSLDSCHSRAHNPSDTPRLARLATSKPHSRALIHAKDKGRSREVRSGRCGGYNSALWPRGQAHQLLGGGGKRRGLRVRGHRSGQEGPKAMAWGARSRGEGRGGGGRGWRRGVRSLRATRLAEARGPVLREGSGRASGALCGGDQRGRGTRIRSDCILKGRAEAAALPLLTS
ncbi:hypothetical protein Cadr_000018107 [Camelus dromedarius]|uniref:Uncharacterized protein n=1 Tax=Camelus dromedarius TaxID=9838 RepID=A0A5N4D6D3_CAMDR|nr:hypothetical protein Cadr_000018107 [Camelus dromedarius]